MFDPIEHADGQEVGPEAHAASTIHLRVMHGLVPVMTNLQFIEELLEILKDGNLYRRQWADSAPACLERLERMTHESSVQIHQLAGDVDYPMAAEMERFATMRTKMTSLTRMRHSLATLNEADWDQALRDLTPEGDGDE